MSELTFDSVPWPDLVVFGGGILATVGGLWAVYLNSDRKLFGAALPILIGGFVIVSAGLRDAFEQTNLTKVDSRKQATDVHIRPNYRYHRSIDLFRSQARNVSKETIALIDLAMAEESANGIENLQEKLVCAFDYFDENSQQLDQTLSTIEESAIQLRLGAMSKFDPGFWRTGFPELDSIRKKIEVADNRQDLVSEAAKLKAYVTFWSGELDRKTTFIIAVSRNRTTTIK